VTRQADKFPSFLRTIVTDKKFKYLLVGVWNTVFAYLAFIVLYAIASRFNIHYMIVLTMSQVVGLTNAYICYKLIVFKTRGNVVREYLRFYLVYGFTFGVNIALIWFMVEIMHMHPVLSQGIIMVIVVVLAYLGHNSISFRPGKQDVPVDTN
jgi:putative flippase GtrA